MFRVYNFPLFSGIILTRNYMWSPKIHVTRSQSQLDLPRHIQKINRLTQSLTFTKPSYKFSNMYDNWLADMSDPRIIPGHSAIFSDQKRVIH